MTFVRGMMPALSDNTKKKMTAIMEPARVKGSGSTRYNLSQVRKNTLPRKAKKRG